MNSRVQSAWFEAQVLEFLMVSQRRMEGQGSYKPEKLGKAWAPCSAMYLDAFRCHRYGEQLGSVLDA
jgi:hypothetical protein